MCVVFRLMHGSVYWQSLERTKGDSQAVRCVLLDVLDHSMELQLSCSRLESVLSVIENEHSNHSEQYSKFDAPAADSKTGDFGLGLSATSGSVSSSSSSVVWSVDAFVSESVARNLQLCQSGATDQSATATAFIALHSVLHSFSSGLSAAVNASIFKPILAAATTPPTSGSSSGPTSIQQQLTQLALLQLLSDVHTQSPPRRPLRRALSVVPLLFCRNINSGCSVHATVANVETTNPYLCVRRRTTASGASAAADSKSNTKTADSKKSKASAGAASVQPIHASITAELSTPTRRALIEQLHTSLIRQSFEVTTSSGGSGSDSKSISAAAAQTPTERTQLINALLTTSTTAVHESDRYALIASAASLLTVWIENATARGMYFFCIHRVIIVHRHF